MDKPFKERRLHLRIYRNFILSYQEKGNQKPVHEVSQINNISRGGLNFSSTHPLKQDALVTVDLKTPFLADSIRIEGIVLECKEKVNGMIYEVRLQFKDVPPQESAVLEKIEKYGKAEADSTD
ncbi:MAG: PilZ domain-containing protein [Candidatus Omnitrophica bacterium]|nr:PilZ domain-containing protein [Candidatus Omnitrophota bacterium]MDE2223266.1 PilZ domain-containing protein [Candidatus Omnitrophota bacterium]